MLLYSRVVYVSAERCAPSALLLVSRPEPAPADSSLAMERRAARRPCVGREATSLYSCATIHYCRQKVRQLVEQLGIRVGGFLGHIMQMLNFTQRAGNHFRISKEMRFSNG